ncbi:MAG: hypothetical protein GY724_11125 [Actinomycetia bacterium]|nr:hypothetical protein [Actinomycetes bacterium]MCP4225502.1 hypothetical protein [Actinomycetes bacterium]MCP5030224.1 hypothetical protein [Actinomycetes bacterium]
MSEKIPARFRKTKTDKWAVMAPVEDLEKALAEGGKVDVLKKSGDWSSFRVASLGRPFEVDGVQMCYGYGPGDEADPSSSAESRAPAESRSPRPASAPVAAPSRDESEPLPQYQGAAEDEVGGSWGDEF